MINEKLEIPILNTGRIFIYVQSYNDKKVQINIYVYDKAPYSSAVDSKTIMLEMSITFRLKGE